MLTEQVARIVSRELDRSRPLWELYLIHGLENGRVAVLNKIHHAAVDGASGAEVLSILLDPTPEPGTVAAPAADHEGESMPSQLSMLGRGLAGLPRQPLRQLKAARRTLPHLDSVPTLRHIPGAGAVASIARRATRPRTRDGGILEGAGLDVPQTMLNAPISPHRRIALSNQSLDEVKRIKNHFGVTVNDVVMAICAGALREWLDDMGELPEQPLVTMVPVSVRTPAQVGEFGNRVSAMMVPIPTDEPDPLRRLERSHEAMRSAKERHQALPASMMADANNVIPPALLGRAARVTTMVGARRGPVSTVISNVPGSQQPQYLAGARLEALYPVSAILDGIAMNITVMSCDGRLNFGVVVDRELVECPEPLAAALERAQAELLALVPDLVAVPALA
jgi:WS/DGAT/MGAT family acyltransferase